MPAAEADALRQQGETHQVLERRSDVLLASFPRSGNTWMLSMMLHSGVLTLTPPAYRACVKHPEELQEFSLLLKPAVQACCERWDRTSLRLLKTHNSPQVCGNRAIYIYRDGRDVVTSYFHYLKREEQLEDDVPFSDFLWRDASLKAAWAGPVDMRGVDVRGPAAAWARHLTDWRTAARFKPMITLRYEDMLADVARCLRETYAFLSVERSDEFIEMVADETSFKRLSAGEQKMDGAPEDASKRFFRSGKAGNWREHFTDDDVEAFKEQAGQTLIEFGYEHDLRWTR
jgi:hypothetical protein